MSLYSRIYDFLKNPNNLTMFRMAAGPIIVILLLFPPNRICTFLAALAFTIAAITDYLDGFLARRDGLVSNFGKAMDPLADKLLVSSSLIMLVSYGWVPAWIACIIIGRELAITALRNIMADGGKDISASWLGKYKVGFQIAAIIPLLLHYPYLGLNMHAIGTFFIWGALIFTLWSGYDYFNRYKELLQN